MIKQDISYLVFKFNNNLDEIVYNFENYNLSNKVSFEVHYQS